MEYFATIFIIFTFFAVTESASTAVYRKEIIDAYLKDIPSLNDYQAEKLAAWRPTDNVNPWELSGKYEGDIILRKRGRNGINNKDLVWPNKVIPYQFDAKVDKEDQKFITKALEYFNKETCLKFRPKMLKDIDYIYVTQEPTGCWSYIGRIGGPQVLNLQHNFCVWYGTVLHEFLHAIGFYHQHSVPDRDVYINVNWKNIEKGYEENFDKYERGEISNLGEIYDYSSIMHYSNTAFSANGQPTMSPIVNGVNLGRNITSALSEVDLKKIKKMYNC